MGFQIVRNDIVKMNTEAIVNTANEDVLVGPGCDMAIYNAAGYDSLLQYRREHIGHVEEGKAFLTPGFNLEAEYIIHAISPVYIDGEHGENEKLRSCYRESLRLAKENGIHSISFPLISTGSFGYPKEEGMRIAVDEIYDFLFDHEMDIFLVVYDDKAAALGEKLQPNLESYIDQNYQSEDIWGESRSRRAVFQSSVNVNLSECDESISVLDLADVENADILEERLNERVKHMSDTFSEYLMYLIGEKGLTNADVYKRAIVDKKTFSKIKNNKNYHPQKITALCLCIGAGLNLDEAKDLLARAGYALSPCDMTDIIFSFFIENQIYDMVELDIQLEEHDLPCIIQ